MNIALLAHDGTKELMVQFCIAYTEFDLVLFFCDP